MEVNSGVTKIIYADMQTMGMNVTVAYFRVLFRDYPGIT
jgi:hypothetical protein